MSVRLSIGGMTIGSEETMYSEKNASYVPLCLQQIQHLMMMIMLMG
jgi:hypothetical protein